MIPLYIGIVLIPSDETGWTYGLVLSEGFQPNFQCDIHGSVLIYCGMLLAQPLETRRIWWINVWYYYYTVNFTPKGHVLVKFTCSEDISNLFYIICLKCKWNIKKCTVVVRDLFLWFIKSSTHLYKHPALWCASKRSIPLASDIANGMMIELLIWVNLKISLAIMKNFITLVQINILQIFNNQRNLIKTCLICGQHYVIR